MMKRAISVLLAIAAISIGMAFAGPMPVAEAQSQPYVQWAAYYGCTTDDIHYRLTEHGMFVNGVPDHKRFYIDIIIGNTMVHQNAYHGATSYDVFPASVRYVTYPGWHVSDEAWAGGPGTDPNHCRFIFSRWTHNTSVQAPKNNCGTVCAGFNGNDSGYWVVSNVNNGGWNDWSNWIIPNAECLFAQDACGGGNNFYYDRSGVTYANGAYQHAGDFYTETFVDGY